MLPDRILPDHFINARIVFKNPIDERPFYGMRTAAFCYENGQLFGMNAISVEDMLGKFKRTKTLKWSTMTACPMEWEP